MHSKRGPSSARFDRASVIALNIRPIGEIEQPDSSDMLPIYFQHQGHHLVGWQMRGALPHLLGVRMNPSLLDAPKSTVPPPSFELDRQEWVRFLSAADNAQMTRPHKNSGASRPNRSNRDYEANWVEMSEGWNDVSTWLRAVLEFSLSDSKGRMKGKLRELKLTSPLDVVEALERYGYLSEKEKNSSIQLAAVYLSHKNRRRPVEAEDLAVFNRLLRAWRKS